MSQQQIDPTTLINVLSHTFNPNTEQRVAAERSLSSIETGASNYCSCLLQIISTQDVPLPIKQAAILRLKNTVVDYWDIQTAKDRGLIYALGHQEDDENEEEDDEALEFNEDGEEIPSQPALSKATTAEKQDLEKRISQQDRQVIKQHLFEAIVHQSQHVIRIQLLECLYHISKTDFPEQWEPLLPALMTSLTNTKDTGRCYAALCSLRMLFKKYQYRSREQREPLNHLVVHTFPTLYQIYNAIVMNDAVEATEMVRIITKIFFVSTQLSVPTYLQKQENLTPWMQLLLRTFERQLPPQQQPPANAPDRATLASTTPLWKSKKWIARTFDDIFSRYGRPTLVSKPNKPFATFFYNSFAKNILSAFMNAFKYRSQGGYITDRVAHRGFQFMEMSCQLKELYPLMKPHLQFIIFESILPALCLSTSDLTLWKEDPQEFVRRSNDIMSQFQDPRITATNCLLELIKKRTRDTLQMTLNAITQIFTTYASSPNESKNYILKEAAMRMFGAMRKLLLGAKVIKQFAASIETVLVQHVFPEFQNPHGFLRARAAWLIGRYAKFHYANQQHHEIAVRHVVTAINDSELPVKLESCTAMSKMMEIKSVVELIKPHLSVILDQYLNLMDDLGNDEVIVTLQQLIEQLDDDVLPYAERIVIKLSTMAIEMFKADAEDDEAALAAIECIRAINTILVVVQTKPAVYPTLERVCQPLLDTYLLNPNFDGIEFYEDALNMMTCFTYYSEHISPFMWSMLPRVCQSYLGNGDQPGWAGDFIKDMFAVFDNFISKGNDRLIQTQDPPYLQMILAICKKLVEGKNELDGQYGAKLFETILAHSKGKIDPIVPDIVQIVGKRLLKAKRIDYKLLLIDCLAGAAYYNPMLFLQSLTKHGNDFLKNIFNHWLSHLPHIKTVKEQTWGMKLKHWKMSVLGLSSLCHVSYEQLPKMLQASLSQVLVELLLVLHEISEAEPKRDAEEAAEEEEDEDDDGDDGEFQDVDDNLDAIDEQEMAEEMTEEHIAAALQKAAQYEQDEVDAQNYQSPLDDQDEYIYFAGSIEALSKLSPAFYNHWGQHLAEDKKVLLRELINRAKQRAEEATKQEQEGDDEGEDVDVEE